MPLFAAGPAGTAGTAIRAALCCARMATPHALLLLAAATLGGAWDGRAALGDDPPPGMAWIRTYAEAKREALQKGRPVFVYFTKTY